MLRGAIGGDVFSVVGLISGTSEPDPAATGFQKFRRNSDWTYSRNSFSNCHRIAGGGWFLAAGEINIVRMNVHEGESALSGNPVEFALPDLRGLLLQQNEQGSNPAARCRTARHNPAPLHPREASPEREKSCGSPPAGVRRDRYQRWRRRKGHSDHEASRAGGA